MGRRGRERERERGRDLEASATGAIPEKVRLRSTASKETAPTKMGIVLTTPSFLETHSPDQSLGGFTPRYVPLAGRNQENHIKKHDLRIGKSRQASLAGARRGGTLAVNQMGIKSGTC